MEWKRGGGRDKETAGVWVRGRKGMWEQEGKDIESLTSACPILLPSSECAERKRKRETICVFPLLQTWLLTHKLRTVWDTQHSVVRELLASSSVQLCPPLSPGPPAHGTIHLKGCMSSQCVLGPLWEQLLTAHSPRREHSLSSPPAELHPFSFLFSLSLLSLHSLFLSLSPVLTLFLLCV